MNHEIEIKNNPNWFVYVLIFGGALVVPGIYLIRKSKWIEFVFMLTLLVLVCIVMFFRKVRITISENEIFIRFSFVGLTYQKIRAEFDRIKGNGVLVFYKGNETTLWIDHGYSYEGNESLAKSMELRYKGKVVHFGNKANSDQIFNKLVGFCKNHPTFSPKD